MFKASVQFDVEMCSARPIYPEMLESVIYLFVCLFSQKKARIRRQRTASVTATSELEGPVSWVETTSWFISSSILFERDNEQMFTASVQFDVEMCSARPIYPKMLELYFKGVIHRDSFFSQKKARIQRQRTVTGTEISELEGPVSWVKPVLDSR